MTEPDQVARYNYDAFVPEKFEPLMRFHESPPLGRGAPDFPLRHLDGSETSLGAIWRQSAYTIVEFGSFT